MSDANVPMSHPATAVKNPDGTYSVRIQHTTEGSVTTVDFTNVLFAQPLAEAYAAMLNGRAAVDAKVSELVSEAKPAVKDASDDIKRLIAEAEVEAKKLIIVAKLEGSTLRAEADGYLSAVKNKADKLYADTKAEAETLLTETKTEATKMLNEARTEAAKLLREAAGKVDATAKPPVVEEE